MARKKATNGRRRRTVQATTPTAAQSRRLIEFNNTMEQAVLQSLELDMTPREFNTIAGELRTKYITLSRKVGLSRTSARQTRRK